MKKLTAKTRSDLQKSLKQKAKKLAPSTASKSKSYSKTSRLNRATSTSVERACCRIDLAGGTLDLWPLYLYQGGLELVNMGIQVYATATITHFKSADNKLLIEIKSTDVHAERKYESLSELAASLEMNTQQNPLRWVNRVAYYHLSQQKKLSGHFIIETKSDAPPGSGLGGSSVLGVALYKAFRKHFGGKSLNAAEKWQIQQNVRDLEAIEIEHPAGDQDYVPALFGGLNVLKLNVGTRKTERLSDTLAKKLSNNLALLYTGKPHHSGINNWSIFKSLHDQKESQPGGIRMALQNIGRLSQELAQDLRKGDLARIPEILNEEWQSRCLLGPAVNAPVLDEAWNHAQKLGAVARKGCGAGGGGCMLFYFPNAALKRAAMTEKLPDPKWKWLNSSPDLST